MSLRDPYHRTVRYLRLSITPACSMRCVYCRPAMDASHKGRQFLSPDEIEAMVRHLAHAHGLKKVRLTGGEPTVRPDLLDIISRLNSIPSLGELVMTTNALTLARQSGDLAAAGLCRVNISLDSLDAQRFARITGVDGLSRVMSGIDAAARAGLTPIKLNTVVVRGENDQELPDLLRFAADRGLEIRFIELMPMGPLADRWAEQFVPESEMRQRLAAVVGAYKPLEHGSSAARHYRVALRNGQHATVGFITAMSCNFCGACDRIRIGADGTLYPCLMDQPTGSLLDTLQPQFDPERFDHRLREGLAHKRDMHPATGAGVMLRIGG